MALSTGDGWFEGPAGVLVGSVTGGVGNVLPAAVARPLGGLPEAGAELPVVPGGSEAGERPPSVGDPVVAGEVGRALGEPSGAGDVVGLGNGLTAGRGSGALGRSSAGACGRSNTPRLSAATASTEA
ncbi:hypothetical protein ACWGIP_27135, partial [Streptomyces sp. NPDC054838]